MEQIGRLKGRVRQFKRRFAPRRALRRPGPPRLHRWSDEEDEDRSPEKATQQPHVEINTPSGNPIPEAYSSRDKWGRWIHPQGQDERYNSSVHPPRVDLNTPCYIPTLEADSNMDKICQWGQYEGQGERFDWATHTPSALLNTLIANPIPEPDSNGIPIWRWSQRNGQGENFDESTLPPSVEIDALSTNPIPEPDSNSVPIWRWSQRDGQGESFSASTQRPSVEIDAPSSNLIADSDSTRGNIADGATVTPITNTTQQKRGRGPAKCTEFEKLRRHGKIPLRINDGETAPCCEYASMFTTRTTWIMKHHGDMSYARWTDVPKSMKDELIDRVKEDFELDWDLKNHRLAVWKQLRKRFNAFHHELHKIYLSYTSHDEALASGPSLVPPLVWVKLCGRWESEEFKKISRINKENRKKLKVNHTAGRKSFVRHLEEQRAIGGNKVDFYKAVHWSKNKNKFVTDATEELHTKMTRRMDEIAPENRTEEVADAVFREVLGDRPGYARGLGEMVIPMPSREKDREREKEYAMLVERHKKDAEGYKTQLDRVTEELRTCVEKQKETENVLRSFMAQFQIMPMGGYAQGMQ